MSSGLAERERIRDLFNRHVGEQVAAAASSLDQVEMGGVTSTVSTLMIDLKGSTTFATQHSAQEVVAMLNRFFSVVISEVDARGGLVNKFMGDRKSTRLNSSHYCAPRMPSSACKQKKVTLTR